MRREKCLTVLLLVGSLVACGQPEPAVVEVEQPGIAVGDDAGHADHPDHASHETNFLDNPALSPTRLMVRVVRASDGVSVPGVDVHVIWRKGDNDAGRLNGTTDGEGVFLCPIRPRSYVHSIVVDPTAATAPTGVMVKEIWEEGRVGDFEVKVFPSSHVVGTLMDIDGNPVPFHPLQAWFMDRWETEVEAPPPADLVGKTNAEGRFLMSGFPRGAFTVAADGDGKVTVQRAGGFLDVGETLEGLELQVAPGQVVLGEVHGSEIGPLNEATVIAGEPGRRADYRSTGHERVFHYPAAQIVVRTRSDGGFELPLVPEGRAWNISVRHGTHQDWYGKIEADQTFLKVEAKAGVLLEGAVVDSSGDPLRQVQARLFSGKGFSARTYKPGIFRFRGLSPDPAAVLMLHLPGYRLVTMFPFEVPQEGPMPEFVLRKSLPIEGHVVDAEGNPVAGASVNASPLSLPGVEDPSFFPVPHPEEIFSLNQVVSNENGDFAFSDLREVEYRVFAKGLEGKESSAVVARPGEERLLRLVVP